MTRTDLHKNIRGEKGVSLVELMVAVTVALIILAGVSMIFVNSRKAYNTQDRLARVQENGRFAMYYLTRDVRMASYMGCIKNPTGGQTTPGPDDANTIGALTSNLNIAATDFAYGISNMAVPLEGIEDASAPTPTWSPSGDTNLPSNANRNAISKSDLLTIRMVDTALKFPIIANMVNETDSLSVSASTAALFRQDDIVLVADCTHADLFQVSNTPSATSTLQHGTGGTPGNLTSSLHKAYKSSENAAILRFSSRRYYVSDNPNGIPSLYMDEGGTNPVEVVEGIESLQILYGVDTDLVPDYVPNRYLKPGQVGLQTVPDWSRVMSIKLGVLARTPNDKDTDIDTNTYDVNGTTLGPFNDRFQRRVFIATISLKDRILP